MLRRCVMVLSVASLVLFAGSAQADVFNMPTGQTSLQFVTVGDPGNASDISGYGSVDYTYRIGKYEVTNLQYTEFLNAVDPAGNNQYSLYNSNMGSGYGGITFSSGNGDGLKYASISGRGNMPVNWVSFWDACRFTNWLNNGQGSADTETGAYTLTASGMSNNTIIRNTDWKYAVTSENEWYKAAYYDPCKSGGAGYWAYPTGSNNCPTAQGPPGDDALNGSANIAWVVGDLTNVGAYSYKPSASPYGTFDQGGNVWEWNDVTVSSDYRLLRGGAFNNAYALVSSYRINYHVPTREDSSWGFRVVSVPEPSTLVLFGVGTVALAACAWRRRRRTA